MTERKRFNPAEASRAGEADAHSLLQALKDAEEGDNLAGLLNDSLAEIIGLGVEHRIEECTARLESFCEVAGPLFWLAVKMADSQAGMVDGMKDRMRKQSELSDRLRVSLHTQPAGPESHLIDAAIAACSLVSEGRIIAVHPDDEDAIVTLCELQLAVRALEPNFTETEGGEI